MNQSIVHIALVVDDYDDAIRFYTEKLDFTLLDDTPQPVACKKVSEKSKGVASPIRRAAEFSCF